MALFSGKLILPLLFLAIMATASDMSSPDPEADNFIKQADEKVRLQKADQAAMKYRANTRFEHRQRRRAKVTRDSKLMEERNAVVSAAAKMMLRAGVEASEAKAFARAQEGYVRRLLAEDRGIPSPFQVAGGHTKPPRVLAQKCSDLEGEEEEETHCDAEHPYRAIDGECNSIMHPSWGAASTPFGRIVAPWYADGHGSPRGGWESAQEPGTMTGNSRNVILPCNRSADAMLPNPRRVSKVIHTEESHPESRNTLMLVLMGQFLDHDITLSPESHVALERCCASMDELSEELQDKCFAVRVPEDDAHFNDRSSGDRQEEDPCNGYLSLTRSVPFCEGHELPVRRQFNAITAFVDASNVYASDNENAHIIRTHLDGEMKVDSSNLLPIVGDEHMAGDVRAIENPALASIHTLWVREHNRVARRLSRRLRRRNVVLTDEDLYQRTRRIVIAEMQNVVYGQWLREVVGPEIYENLHLDPTSDSSYDPEVDPSIYNSFAAAAFRFGHSMIQDFFVNVAATTSARSSWRLKDNFFNETIYRADCDAVLNGLQYDQAQTMDADVVPDLTRGLFQNLERAGDLVSRNLQRAREHGVAGYNEFREACGMERACSWDEPPSNIPSEAWERLSTLYDSPSDIDLFTAGLLEDQLPGANVGATFGCLIGGQFKALKFGDRFFFTHNPTADSGIASGATPDPSASNPNHCS